jgi:DNA-binding transcriptional MerR regulator
MRIGEVAARAGVSTKTVRHYESQGVLSSSRLPNGYRDYDENAVRLVSEAHVLGALGIRLGETRPFLDCLSAGNERSMIAPIPSLRTGALLPTSMDGSMGSRRAAMR